MRHRGIAASPLGKNAIDDSITTQWLESKLMSLLSSLSLLSFVVELEMETK